MDLQSLIENYGYAAILVGTFLEGETILVLAGLAAHQGYLVLTWVIIAAFAGSLCGDQLFFYLGRKHSQAVLARRPAWKQKAEKVHKMMNRFQTPMILSFRFLYGLAHGRPLCHRHEPRIRQKVRVAQCRRSAGLGGQPSHPAAIFSVSALAVLIGKLKSYEIYIMGSVAMLVY